MNITLFSPHKGQKTIIDGFADSAHKFGVVATGRQFGKSLLAQNMMLYWLLSSSGQKGAWIAPVYNQCKKVFSEITNASHEIITNKIKLTLLLSSLMVVLYSFFQPITIIQFVVFPLITWWWMKPHSLRKKQLMRPLCLLFPRWVKNV
jgi:hypothetical protein